LYCESRSSSPNSATEAAKRDSQYKGNASFDQVLTLGKQAKGKDDEGYRAEFLHLVESAQLLGSSEPVDK